jgi:hypothetical protein
VTVFLVVGVFTAIMFVLLSSKPVKGDSDRPLFPIYLYDAADLLHCDVRTLPAELEDELINLVDGSLDLDMSVILETVNKYKIKTKDH